MQTTLFPPNKKKLSEKKIKLLVLLNIS